MEFGDDRIPERFWRHVRVNPQLGCWERTKGLMGRPGGVTGSRYSRFQNEGVSKLAHRLTCELEHGPPPVGKPFCLHSCDNPCCVNPEHLRWGSDAENKRDVADRRTSPHLKKTHCPRGHPYSGDNLKEYDGRRFCRECARDANLKYYYKVRQEPVPKCPNGHLYEDGSFRIDAKGHRQCIRCLMKNRARRKERRRGRRKDA